MKKILIIMVFSIILLGLLNAQDCPCRFEDFEEVAFPPVLTDLGETAPWTVIDNDGDFNTWFQGTIPCSGLQSAGIIDIGVDDDWLITPCLCLDPEACLVFDFWAAVYHPGVFVDFEVLISPLFATGDCGDCPDPDPNWGWVTIDQVFVFDNTVCENFTYDLTPYAADNMCGYVAIRVTNINIGGFIVDDVTYPCLCCDDPPCPVTLSSFTGASVQGEYVSLTWTCESESDMLGYRVYRSQSDIGSSEFTSPLIVAENLSYLHDYNYEDYEVENEATYNYWLEGVACDGSTESWGPVTLTVSQEEPEEVPEQTVLMGNYPNPFRPKTNIEFNIRKDSQAILTIFNTKGQIVERAEFDAGYHNFEWNAGTNSSGIYFYKLESDNYSETRKMILLK